MVVIVEDCQENKVYLCKQLVSMGRPGDMHTRQHCEGGSTFLSLVVTMITYCIMAERYMYCNVYYR
jgi:hypothetical protein